MRLTNVALTLLQTAALTTASSSYGFFSSEISRTKPRATCEETQNPNREFFSNFTQTPQINEHFTVAGEKLSAISNANFCTDKNPFVKALRFYVSDDMSDRRIKFGMIFIFSSLADAPRDARTGLLNPVNLHPTDDFYVAVLDEYTLTPQADNTTNIAFNSNAVRGKVTYNWTSSQNQCQLTGVALEGFAFISGLTYNQSEMSKNSSKIYFTRQNQFADFNGMTGMVEMVPVHGGHPALKDFNLFCPDEFQRHVVQKLSGRPLPSPTSQ